MAQPTEPAGRQPADVKDAVIVNEQVGNDALDPADTPTGTDYLTYLRFYRNGSPHWGELFKVCDALLQEHKISVEFGGEYWINAIEKIVDISETKKTELIETLIQSSTEWRLDVKTRYERRRAGAHDPMKVPSYIDPQPIPQNRCRFTAPGSERPCGRGTIPGTTRCRDHGGTLANEKTRRAVLMGAYLGMVDASDEAVGVLVDVARNGRNDLARVQAARELLDRAGLTADLNITVRIEGDERTQRIEQLQSRLATMGDAIRHRAIDATAHPTDIDISAFPPPRPGNHANSATPTRVAELVNDPRLAEPPASPGSDDGERSPDLGAETDTEIPPRAGDRTRRHEVPVGSDVTWSQPSLFPQLGTDEPDNPNMDPDPDGGPAA